MRNFLKRIHIPPVFWIAFGVIYLAELFVCNNLYFRNIGNEEESFYVQENDDNVTLNGLSVLYDGTVLVEDNGEAGIEIRNLDLVGKSLYIDLTDMEWSGENKEKSADFLVEIIDESHNNFYSRAGIKTVSARMEQTKYLSLRPMGNLKAIRINIRNVGNGDVLHIRRISLNRKWPLFFSVPRVLLFFFLFVLAYGLRKGSPLYNIRYDSSKKWQKAVSLLTLLVVLAICFRLSGYLTQGSRIWYKNPYDLLAHSMANGQVDLDIDMPADESLLALSDPYVPSNRGGVSYMWDCAFYEGKYYVYYGVVPEILFYLPHYLLTGKDFGITPVARIELALYIIGIFLCFLELGKRFNGKIPYVTWILLFLASIGGLQVILLSKQILFYHIPIIMGCAMLSLGIYFWLSSKKKNGNAYSILRLALGSLCMALAVGCRPQFVFGSILALPIFSRYFFEKPGQGRTVKRTVGYLISGAVPYVIIMGLLFYYNAIRFGSPFDFGARYNLTSIDVTRVSANFGKLIPGLFWYLFVPVRITTVFPFIENAAFFSSYTGDFFALYSNGGFMVCNPLTFFIIFGFTRKKLFANVYHRALFFTCIVITSVILWIDIMMGGFMTRYFCDFSIFLHLASLPVICMLIEHADTRANRYLLPVISLICAGTILYHYLSYYVGESGAFFCKFDREVFLRASLLWQWWE